MHVDLYNTVHLPLMVFVFSFFFNYTDRCMLQHWYVCLIHEITVTAVSTSCYTASVYRLIFLTLIS